MFGIIIIDSELFRLLCVDSIDLFVPKHVKESFFIQSINFCQAPAKQTGSFSSYFNNTGVIKLNIAMGLLIAGIIIIVWLGHLTFLLAFGEVSVTSPLLLLSILVQMYLYTGLFITAHDAMHGLVSPNRRVNKAVGHLATFLFAGLSYSRLLEKHKLHHRYPGEAADPDYCTTSQNFWKWWFSFMKNYITWQQLVIMAIVFNLLLLWVDQWKLLLFWVLPSILSTFQLFYFGTYRPHQLPHTPTMMPHHARTQGGPHWWAMLSCYFFGYHYEHHESPRTPWWQLYKVKNQYDRQLTNS